MWSRQNGSPSSPSVPTPASSEAAWSVTGAEKLDRQAGLADPGLDPLAPVGVDLPREIDLPGPLGHRVILDGIGDPGCGARRARAKVFDVNVRKRFQRRGRASGSTPTMSTTSWWALSCTSLGMLLVATNSGTLIIALPDLERSLGTSLLELVWVILAYMISSTVLVLTAGRLSDLFGRKTAFVGAFIVFGLASLGAGFAADGHRADPLADPAGDRRRLHLRQRPRPRHRRLPARAARAGDGHEHDGRRDRARDRPGPRRRPGRDLLALGLLVQRAARARRGALGGADPARALRAATPSAASTSAAPSPSSSASPGSSTGSRAAASPAGTTRW